jgi:hypothetical protein
MRLNKKNPTSDGFYDDAYAQTWSLVSGGAVIKINASEKSHRFVFKYLFDKKSAL